MLAVLGLLGLAVAALPFAFGPLVSPRLTMLEPLQRFEVTEAVRTGLSLFAVGGLSALVVAVEGLVRRRDEAPVAPVAAATAVLLLVVGSSGLPALDRVKSYRRLVEPVVRKVPPEARYGLVELRPGPFNVALDRHDLERFDGLRRGRRALARMKEDPNLVIFVRPDDYRAMLNRTEFPLAILASRRVGRREILAVQMVRRQ